MVPEVVGTEECEWEKQGDCVKRVEWKPRES